MDQALAYLRIGHIGFELALADKLHGMYPDKPIFDLSENVPLIVGHCQDEGHNHSGHDHSGEGTDPHIWMSVSNARIIAQNSRNALVEVLPGLQQEIDQNFERLQLDLDTLDRHIRQTIETSDVRSFAIFHPSLAYFSEEYGLEQIAIEDEGKDPSAAHLRLVMDQIKQKGIRTILVQREFNQEQALVIAKEAGLEIRVIDPLSPEWRESIVSIVDAITWQP
jgi:zinc transport system substrate-binding protein